MSEKEGKENNKYSNSYNQISKLEELENDKQRIMKKFGFFKHRKNQEIDKTKNQDNKPTDLLRTFANLKLLKNNISVNSMYQSSGIGNQNIKTDTINCTNNENIIIGNNQLNNKSTPVDSQYKKIKNNNNGFKDNRNKLKNETNNNFITYNKLSKSLLNLGNSVSIPCFKNKLNISKNKLNKIKSKSRSKLLLSSNNKKTIKNKNNVKNINNTGNFINLKEEYIKNSSKNIRSKTPNCCDEDRENNYKPKKYTSSRKFKVIEDNLTQNSQKQVNLSNEQSSITKKEDNIKIHIEFNNNNLDSNNSKSSVKKQLDNIENKNNQKKEKESSRIIHSKSNRSMLLKKLDNKENNSTQTMKINMESEINNIKNTHDNLKQTQKLKKRNLNDLNLEEKISKHSNANNLIENSYKDSSEAIEEDKKKYVITNNKNKNYRFNVEDNNSSTSNRNKMINSNSNNSNNSGIRNSNHNSNDLENNIVINNHNNTILTTTQFKNDEIIQNETLTNNNNINNNLLQNNKTKLSNIHITNINNNLNISRISIEKNKKFLKLFDRQSSCNVSPRLIIDESTAVNKHIIPNNEFKFINFVKEENEKFPLIKLSSFLRLKEFSIYKLISFCYDNYNNILKSNKLIEAKIKKSFKNIFSKSLEDFNDKYKGILSILNVSFDQKKFYYNRKNMYVFNMTIDAKVTFQGFKTSYEIGCLYLLNTNYGCNQEFFRKESKILKKNKQEMIKIDNNNFNINNNNADENPINKDNKLNEMIKDDKNVDKINKDLSINENNNKNIKDIIIGKNNNNSDKNKKNKYSSDKNIINNESIEKIPLNKNENNLDISNTSIEKNIGVFNTYDSESLKKKSDLIWKFDIQKKNDIKIWISSEISVINNIFKRFTYSSQVSAFSYEDEIQLQINIFNKGSEINPYSLEWRYPSMEIIEPEVYENSRFISPVTYDCLRACEVETQILLWKNENVLDKKLVYENEILSKDYISGNFTPLTVKKKRDKVIEEFKHLFKKNFNIKKISYDISKFLFYKIEMKAIKLGIIKCNKYLTFEIEIVGQHEKIKNEIQCIFLMNTNYFNNKMQIRLNSEVTFYIVDMI